MISDVHDYGSFKSERAHLEPGNMDVGYDLAPVTLDEDIGITEGGFLQDGVRRIDLVIVYSDEPGMNQGHLRTLRTTFEEGMIRSGLVTEKCHGRQNTTVFIKVHVPFKILCDAAQDCKMRKPFALSDIDIVKPNDNIVNRIIGNTKLLSIKDPSCPTLKPTFATHFSSSHLQDYIGHEDPNTFFSTMERSHLAHYILERVRYGEGKMDFGIDHLVHSGALLTYYPVHDASEDAVTNGSAPQSERQQLYEDWATFSPRRILKNQPIQAIRNYFGEKVAFYFAWAELYTKFLFPIAILGLLTFFYGLITQNMFDPIKEVCDTANEKSFYMCNICDRQCSYWSLTTTCLASKVVYWFSNNSTIALACLVSLWATFFIEFWKRKQSTLACVFHTIDFEKEEEVPRPEFVAKATTTKLNLVTQEMEPSSTVRHKVTSLLGAWVAVLFMISVVIIAVVAVIVYRAIVFAVLANSKDRFLESYAKIVVSITASIINLIVINLLKYIYKYLAERLTDWENPRTWTDYEDSFTLKMFWFQFANTYASIFYVAFFKSEWFVGVPGNYTRFLGYRLEGCSAQGCMSELIIQLVIIMVGQQILNNILEVGIPYIKEKIRAWKLGKTSVSRLPQWEEDYLCEQTNQFTVFTEYLELILQFGFVTMFVAAFPLAPVFALLNNIVEIRLDATNFLFAFRRPIGQVAEDIGAWIDIMDIVSRLSVLVNAFVIAFTSDFIPQFVYRYSNPTLKNFVNSSLSFASISDLSKLEPDNLPVNPTQNLNYTMPYCRYRGYYNSSPPFKPTEEYYKVIAARFVFVFLFQLIVSCIKATIAWIVPDVPEIVEQSQRREAFLVRRLERSWNKQPLIGNVMVTDDLDGQVETST